MTSNNQYPPKVYKDILASQNVEFRDTIYEKMPLIIDSYLMSYGEVADYSGHRHFAATLVDALLIYLVADGWVALTDKSIAQPEEKKENLAKFATYKEQENTYSNVARLDLRPRTES